MNTTAPRTPDAQDDADVEHLDFLVVGAGISGICAAHYIQADCPWASYAVFEGRPRMGGTWDLFRYPGIRSDSDMYTLGFSFRPWRDPEAIADGDQILQYLVDTAEEEGITPKIRFDHWITSADWSTEDARWTVKGTDRATGEAVHVTCSFLISASGYYRYDRGYTPEFAGRDDFAGEIVHPQFWPEDFDATGKRIVVIGSGATAVTLIPNLAKDAQHVTMLQRSPTYIVAMPAKDPLAKLVRRIVPARWEDTAIRWMKALMTQGSYNLSRKRPNLVRRLLLKLTKMQLPEGYDVDTHFTPHYDPWDQRLCLVPDGDLFKAIKSGSASVVTDHIDRFTENGIRTTSGAELEADVIVTATGLDVQFMGGIEATVDGEPIDVASKLSYKGMMLEDVPNLVQVVGYTNASWTLKAELTCEYAMRIANHLRALGMRQATPRNTDGAAGEAPMLDLTSGYIQRAKDRMPRQGERFPWKVYQSFLQDYRATRRSEVDDGVMSFTNPTRDAAGTRRRLARTTG